MESFPINVSSEQFAKAVNMAGSQINLMRDIR